MTYANPSISDFQALFFRDFPYGSTLDTVTNQDITNAFNLVNINFNQALWQNQDQFSLGYLYLAAHFLVLNLRASQQGLSGQYNWLENSKGAGSVSASFNIPQRILDNPEYSWLTKTNYGAQYLMLVLPLLSGQMYSVRGRTNP